MLDEDNAWYCRKCKEHKLARKTLQIYKTPKILIVHFKRFKTANLQQYGSTFFQGHSHKINTNVSLPFNGFDISDFVLSKKEGDPSLIYDVFAISNHYGSLAGGHYTAFGLNHIKKKWY